MKSSYKFATAIVIIFGGKHDSLKSYRKSMILVICCSIYFISTFVAHGKFLLCVHGKFNAQSRIIFRSECYQRFATASTSTRKPRLKISHLYRIFDAHLNFLIIWHDIAYNLTRCNLVLNILKLYATFTQNFSFICSVFLLFFAYFYVFFLPYPLIYSINVCFYYIRQGNPHKLCIKLGHFYIILQ